MPSFRSSHMLYVPFPSMHRALMSLPSHETTPYHRTLRTQTIRRDRLVLLPLLLAIANTQHGCCCNCLSTGEPLDNDVQSTRDASESIAITRLKPTAPVALTSFPPFFAVPKHVASSEKGPLLNICFNSILRALFFSTPFRSLVISTDSFQLSFARSVKAWSSSRVLLESRRKMDETNRNKTKNAAVIRGFVLRKRMRGKMRKKKGTTKGATKKKRSDTNMR